MRLTAPCSPAAEVAQLVARARQGEEAAFAELVRRPARASAHGAAAARHPARGGSGRRGPGGAPRTPTSGAWQQASPVGPYAELGLSADQERRSRAVLEKHRPRVEAVWRAMTPRLRAISDDVERELRRLLTAEQARRLDEIKARRPGPPPLPPPPPPPAGAAPPPMRQ